MIMDIKLIKELRAMKKQSQANIDYLKLKMIFGVPNDKFNELAEKSILVFQDQIDSADSMIHDELNR